MPLAIEGIYPALLTPFTKDEEVNETALKQLVNRLIVAKVNGIFALGTNGEFHVLSREEKLNITKMVVEETAGRVPVMVGSGGNSTREVIELSQAMEKLGVDALSVITPYFIPPTQEEAEEHYRKVAEAVSIPVVLYNIPSKTGFSLAPETVGRLAKMPNIVGIKDSSGDFSNIEQYIAHTRGEHFSVIAGTDSLILKTLQAGGTGAVAATANLLPETVVAIYNSWKAGDYEKAQAAQQALQPLRDTFGLTSIPASLKKAVELSGIPVGPARAPIQEPTGEVLKQIEAAVQFYKTNQEG
ncbi:4-hydroxy-tetrahydrodipicolinate synthase [Paenibacillus algorifonticola]|uniref:4-hydroxy-tetrahydrodipicolinate synthase n=1 Tax=Paenibacillus algorifonticola TaxID=684063 RepID=A0A1I1YMF4_9BACL|nr:4-hydroxy-tetrahydrodipicolinate synthase [Paenibacillus algorifonticola]SFE20794.1 4-hydroxy-tetrahydrodipicolinate synthase [Paenibacillus algorifonticola]